RPLFGSGRQRQRKQSRLALGRHITGQRRIEIHRSHEITDGIARVAQVSEGCATEEIGPGELWIELDRLGLIFYRTFVVMLNQEHISSFAPQGSSFRLQTDSRRIVRKCAAE